MTDEGERLPERLRGKSHIAWDVPFPMWLIFLASLLFSATMITKFITDVSTKFNPFSKRAKTCRIFLAHLPSSARQTMNIDTKILPRTSREGSTLSLKFSKFIRSSNLRLSGIMPVNEEKILICTLTEDGKEMQLDTEKLTINDVMEEVDRHSRKLNRQADLMGNS